MFCHKKHVCLMLKFTLQATKKLKKIATCVTFLKPTALCLIKKKFKSKLSQNKRNKVEPETKQQ